MSGLRIGCLAGQLVMFTLADCVIGTPKFGWPITIAIQGGAIMLTQAVFLATARKKLTP